MRQFQRRRTDRARPLPWQESPRGHSDSGGTRTGAAPVEPELDDLLRQYLIVKSASSSPLRDDLDSALGELDRLIVTARVDSATVLHYLHFEMEQRRLMIIDALRSGYEL